MLILVGNFIQDFNYEMMAKCLRVPDEKFRDKVHKTMYENLTTFLRETGEIPANADLAAELAWRYTPLLGELIPRQLDQQLMLKADELLAEMNTPAWLMANDRRRPDTKQVKIAEGVFVLQKLLKTPGGLIRVTAVNQNGSLKDVHISGDFFFFPAERLLDLEKALDGLPVETGAIAQAVTAFYSQHRVESPGVAPADFASALTA
jgi:lipoate-protein ligase A